MTTAPRSDRTGTPKEAFEFRPELVAHARRRLGPESDAAEDVVQEAFVHLLRRTREGNPPREARPWLYKVVSSLCLRERARARRQPPTEAHDRATSSVDPAGIAELNAELRWALTRVADLPARERATLIADLAGLPQSHDGANARYQALHRARRKLRTLRAESWGLLPLPLIRWRMPFGAGGTGVAAGVGAAPTALAAGGIVKVAVVVASAVVALGGAQMLASFPAPGAPPAAPGVVSAPQARTPALPGSATGPSAATPPHAVAIGRGPRSARTSTPATAPTARPPAQLMPVSVPAPTHPAEHTGARPGDAPSNEAEPADGEIAPGEGQEDTSEADGDAAHDGGRGAPEDEDGPGTGTDPAAADGSLTREEGEASDTEGERTETEDTAHPETGVG